MVNILLKVALALIFFSVVACQEPVELIPYATSGNWMHTFFAEHGCTYNAAGGKYIIVQDINGNPAGRIIVFIRDDQGTYTTRLAQMQWPRWSALITTNGNWIGTLDENGFVDTFQVNSTNSFVNITSFASSARFIQFLSDNTLVLIDQSSIDTFEYVNGNWTKILHQTVLFAVDPYLQINGGNVNNSVPHLTDTTLAAFNPVTAAVELYTRNADRSWTRVDELPMLTTQYRANRIIWNGDDTIILSDNIYVLYTNNYGSVSVYQKSDTWRLTSFLYNTEISPWSSYLGFSMLLVDRDLIAISAPREQSGGTVFYLQRRPGMDWQVTTHFIGRSERFYFGFSLMKTDSEIVVQTQDSNTFHSLSFQATIPPCYLPIKYKCQNVIIDTCQTIDISDYTLYTVGDSCTVVSLESIVNTEYNTTVTFSFARGEFETRYCNSTITCVNPPVTPVSSPIASEPPTSSPLNQPVVSPTSSVNPSAPSVAPSSSTPVASPIVTPSAPSAAPISSVPVTSPVATPSAPSIVPTSSVPVVSPSVPSTVPISKAPVASPSAPSAAPISSVPVARPISTPSDAGLRPTSDSSLQWLDMAAIVCVVIVSLA